MMKRHRRLDIVFYVCSETTANPKTFDSSSGPTVHANLIARRCLICFPGIGDETSVGTGSTTWP